MHREESLSVTGPATPLFAPFPLLLAGMGLVAAAWLMGAALQGNLPALRVALLVLGVVAVGAAAAFHVSYARLDLEGRLGSAGTWLLATATLFVARSALDPTWDSIALLFNVLMLAGAATAVVTVLPRPGRQFAISLLILFHLGGILSAIVVRPPKGGEPPWLAKQAWTRVYRPYLMFTRLDDPYHFFTPKPELATLLWFRVAFADGTSHWTQVPDHAECHNPVEYRRLAALATALNSTTGLGTPHTDDERLFLEHFLKRRIEAGKTFQPPIPPADTMPLAEQFREPTIEAKLLLASYVRHVARTTKHPLGHDVPVAAVKVYRVEYTSPPAMHFQAGRSPRDPALYQAWYQGEYEPDGRLITKLEIVRNARGEQIGHVQDPFLYWLIPIVRVPNDPAAVKDRSLPGLPIGAQRTDDPVVGPWTGEGKIVNFVRIHAGDSATEEQERVP
jgi:hypothetical protein